MNIASYCVPLKSINSTEVTKFSEHFSVRKDEWSEHDSQKKTDRQVVCMELDCAESVTLFSSTTTIDHG